MGDFDAERWVLTPNRWLRGLGWGAIALGVAITALMIVGHTGAYGIGSPFLVLGTFAAYLGNRVNLWPRKKRAKVHADGKGISVDGEMRVAREDVTQAYVQPLARYPLVRVQGKGRARNLDVVVADAAEGTRVLEALELDAAHHAVTFRGPSPLQTTAPRQVAFGVSMALGMMLMGVLAHVVGAWLLALMPFLVIALATLSLVPSAIAVGADGVLTRWLGMRHFYPYDEFDTVTPTGHGVTLLGKSGKSVHVATAPARTRTSAWKYAQLTRDAVHERVAEAQRAYAAHKETHAAALVARSGRTMAEWLEALRSLAASDDYREAAVPREALWRIAEDPAAEATARAGAAVALRGKLDEADRARLRVAAESSVSPHVRVALEAAATAEDDGEVAAALERLHSAS
jgi:hypothetical protein